METERELEWQEAQKTVINVDLVEAAKRQLKFLAAVDKNRWLYESPALDTAIHRYNFYWLPLLAKHMNSPLVEGPLVVPFDCEWIWHCHRLNPVKYKSDCKELFDLILDNSNVVSCIDDISKSESEEIWKMTYPDEPYELDLNKYMSKNVSKQIPGIDKCTEYDLVSAVKRQSPFFYQVARPHMENDLYLEGSVARYKGFLHLIKRNKENAVKSFSVPTYDIDLIWHTHQLHPSSYCKDLIDIMGKVLEHDDTDSDRSEGAKLNLGFTETTKQWEEMYGLRYWRAGAMYKGTTPSPLRTIYHPSTRVEKKSKTFTESPDLINLPFTEAIEVMLEFVSLKNQPDEQKGSFFVSFHKTHPDVFFSMKRNLSILSEIGEKQGAVFQCQPTGVLRFELMKYSGSASKAGKAIAYGSILMKDLLSEPNLSMEKWIELEPKTSSGSPNPICLRVAISVTLPTPAPNTLHMIRSRSFSKITRFFPLLGKLQLTNNWTCVVDDNGNDIISLQLRDHTKPKDKKDDKLGKEVIGVTESGGTHSFAKCSGNDWLLMDSQWSMKLPGTVHVDGHLFELNGGYHTVNFFPGRKLDYEPKLCEHKRNELDFLTAVEFSEEYPYGNAVGLFDLKFGVVKVNREWLLSPALIVAFIVSEIMRKEGYNGLYSAEKNLKEKEVSVKETVDCNAESKKDNLAMSGKDDLNSDMVVHGEIVKPLANGGLHSGGGCGGGCGGDMMKSGGCGGCGGGGCGGGCGGGRVGSMYKKAGCGGCGGGCDNKLMHDENIAGKAGGVGGQGESVSA